MTGPDRRLDDSAAAAVTEDADPSEGLGTHWAGHHPHGIADDSDFQDVPPPQETGMAGEADPATGHASEDEERGGPDVLP